MPHIHREPHRAGRIGWLRAAVLGANDGTISVASLVVGVAAAGAPQGSILLTGVAGLVAGAMSMAAGEYVSVQSQADTEEADIKTEKRGLEIEPERELAELTSIYVSRGLDQPLARLVAEKLMSSDALGAHARDELGITETCGHGRSRPRLPLHFFCCGCDHSDCSSVAGAFSLGCRNLCCDSARYVSNSWGNRRICRRSIYYQGAMRVAFWGALAMGLRERWQALRRRCVGDGAK